MTDLRVLQHYITVKGRRTLTRYDIQQRIDGQWTNLPVIFKKETDPSVLLALGIYPDEDENEDENDDRE